MRVPRRPGSQRGAAVQTTQRLSFGDDVNQSGEHRRDVYFARRSTVAHRCGRHHGTVKVRFHKVFQRPGLPSGRRHMGQRQGAGLAEKTPTVGVGTNWPVGKARGVLDVWLRILLARGLSCVWRSTTGSSFLDQCSASQEARDSRTQEDGRQKRSATVGGRESPRVSVS